MPMTTKFGRVVTYFKWLPNHKVTLPLDHVVFQDFVTN